jgi:small subunit ribosomal protein S16
MSVRIRLARHGTRKRPFYRIVVTDSESPRDGRFIERVGLYDPRSSPSRIEFSREKVVGWLRKGAQPSDTVAQLMKRAGIDYRAREAAETASVE